MDAAFLFREMNPRRAGREDKRTLDSVLAADDYSKLKAMYDESNGSFLEMIKAQSDEAEEEQKAFYAAMMDNAAFANQSITGLFVHFVEHGTCEAVDILAGTGLVPPVAIVAVVRKWHEIVDGRPGMAILTNLTGRYENPYDGERQLKLLRSLFRFAAVAPLLRFDFSVADTIGILFPPSGGQYVHTLTDKYSVHIHTGKVAADGALESSWHNESRGSGDHDAILRAIAHIRASIADLPYKTFSTIDDTTPVTERRWRSAHDHLRVILQ